MHLSQHVPLGRRLYSGSQIVQRIHWGAWFCPAQQSLAIPVNDADAAGAQCCSNRFFAAYTSAQHTVEP
jgi:hypothetical protein